jgi:hypothetical protein
MVKRHHGAVEQGGWSDKRQRWRRPGFKSQPARKADWIYKRRITLKADIKKRWVDALRSGEYQQGRELLVQNDVLGDRFCCLGVLCEIAVADGILIREGHEYYAKDNKTDVSDAILPMAVLRWADLPDQGHNAPEVPIPLREAAYLTTLNDQLEYNFGQIADVIEEKL